MGHASTVPVGAARMANTPPGGRSKAALRKLVEAAGIDFRLRLDDSGRHWMVVRIPVPPSIPPNCKTPFLPH